MAINVGFQAFAVVTAFVADSEIRARTDLAGVNVELRAARELLAESNRASERLRISRELHHVMGHNLTALSIHLEVARIARQISVSRW
jgi:signal transduction histidine kinase